MVIGALKKEKRYNIVCATTTILKPGELGPNTDRFYACEILPAYLVYEMADIALLYGGQGTIQTAVCAGTPFFGIGFQAEQQANIDGLVRAGMAKRIPVYSLSEKSVLKALRLVNNSKYKTNALKMKNIVRKVDGVKKSVDVMNNYILGRLN